ncbi:hypothetical protein M3Y97_00676900 [Aphelenchoides bicaudatus]|nr:hypothetical protein M3Y97_00676900 [Aphelenchoides bicaudatus]
MHSSVLILLVSTACVAKAATPSTLPTTLSTVSVSTGPTTASTTPGTTLTTSIPTTTAPSSTASNPTTSIPTVANTQGPRPTRQPPRPNTCRDLVNNCARAGRYCNDPKVGATIQKNCPLTCGTGPCANSPNVPCHDNSGSACFNWARNGLCQNQMMRPVAEKSCKSTCNLCQQNGSAGTQSVVRKRPQRQTKRRPQPQNARKPAPKQPARNVQRRPAAKRH